MTQNHTSIASLAFVDASLPDLATLLAGLPAGLDVQLLDPAADGLAQMARHLAHRADVPALHVVTHGQPGALHLGTLVLNRQGLTAHAAELDTLCRAMAEDGEILIYGCDMAAGFEGQRFVQALRLMTGLQVAAATHKVGAEALGGSWELDDAPDMARQAGAMQHALAVPQWQGVLVGDRNITYSAATFAEAAANDGSITASITLTLASDTYTGTNGQALAGAVVTNVPTGLTAVVTKTSDTVATVTFTGNATAHANTNDVDNLTITLSDVAFTGGSAAAVINATKSNLVIDFADPAATTGTQTGYIVFPPPVSLAGGVTTSGGVAIGADGKIILAGAAINFGINTSDNIAVRLNADGSLDSSFGSAGMAVIDIATGANRNDGTYGVLAAAGGGYFIYGTGVYGGLITKLTSAGAIDITWGSSGSYEPGSSSINVATIDGAGNLYLVNDGTKTVTKLTAAGALASGWGTNGVSVAYAGAFTPNKLIVQTDGTVLISGSTGNTTTDNWALSKLTAAGAIDTSFGGGDGLLTYDSNNGSATAVDSASHIAVQSDGKIVLAGTSNKNGFNHVVRFNADGTPDATFNASGTPGYNAQADLLNDDADDINNNDYANGVALDANGKILVYGATGAITGNGSVFVARLNADGTLDTSFGSSGYARGQIEGTYQGPSFARALLVQSDGKIVVQGTVNSTAFGNGYMAALRFDADGSLDTTFGFSSPVPTVTHTSATYDAVTNTLTLTGTNFDTLWSAAETATTDIKARLDWSKLSWDINGDDGTTANVGFAVGDITSAKVTNGTTLTIVLADAKGTSLEGTTGYGATGNADTLDIAAGFARDAAGNAATTDALADGALSLVPVIGGITVADNSSFIAGTHTYLDAATDYAYITDADSANLNGGYLNIAYTSGTANGTFRFDPALFDNGAPAAGGNVAVLASSDGGTTLKTDGSFAAGDSVVVISAGSPVTKAIAGTVDATAHGQAGSPLKINFTANATTGANSNDGAAGYVLQFLQYTAPTGGARVFAITANDGTNTSTPAAVTLTAQAAPVIDLNGAADGINKTATHFVGSSNQSFFADAINNHYNNISDSDSTYLKSLSVSIPIASIKAGDSLNFLFSGGGTIAIDGTGTGTVTVNPFNFDYDYAVTDSGANRIITFTLHGSATGLLTRFETLLDRMAFKTTNTDAPVSRVFSVSVTDESDHVSPAATFTVTTALAPAITYSAATFAESPANNGSITASITLTLANDTYTGTNGQALAGAVVTHVPDGLTAVVTKTSDTVATVTFTGNATAHANANDVANLTITLGNAAFTGGSAAAVTNATKADLAIDFADPAAPPAPAPDPDPAPTPAPPPPTTTTVDGTTVQTQTTTQTNSNGTTTTTTTQTVTPVTNTRPEDANTPNTGLADIPLATDRSGAPTIQVSLPVGVGLVSESTSTASGGTPLTLREQLINASQPRVGESAQMQDIIANGIDQYVPSVGDQSQVTVRTITLTVSPPAGGGTATAPAQPIVIRGASGIGEADPANPQRGEALVIDARNLPPGTVLDLSMVEFAIIIGPTTATGGTGQNYVIGDGSAQFIVLGPEDDIIRGGAGDDTIGSKGGDDQLFGDEGNDWVVGGVGHDTLQGGDGNDTLQGGASDAGTWSFKLTAQGQLQASFVPTSTELADSTGFAATGVWTHPQGTGPITDERFAWVYDDYGVAQDVALLVHALTRRLPTLAEIGGLADGTYNSNQLGEMAHSHWKQNSVFVLDTVQGQMTQVINKVWGSGSATTELINLGVNHINGGGSWSDIWLALTRHGTHANRITDAQGNISLIGNQHVSDMGWSASSGNDVLLGGAGNDVLIGGGGNDTLDGGEGTDMAVWFGAIADYQVAVTPSTAQGATAGAHDTLIRHKLTGEVDTVRNVELFKIGATAYTVPVGQPQPADGVYVELSSYVQVVGVGSTAAIGFHPDWIA